MDPPHSPADLLRYLTLKINLDDSIDIITDADETESAKVETSFDGSKTVPVSSDPDPSTADLDNSIYCTPPTDLDSSLQCYSQTVHVLASLADSSGNDSLLESDDRNYSAVDSDQITENAVLDSAVVSDSCTSSQVVSLIKDSPSPIDVSTPRCCSRDPGTVSNLSEGVLVHDTGDSSASLTPDPDSQADSQSPSAPDASSDNQPSKKKSKKSSTKSKSKSKTKRRIKEILKDQRTLASQLGDIESRIEDIHTILTKIDLTDLIQSVALNINATCQPSRKKDTRSRDTQTRSLVSDACVGVSSPDQLDACTCTESPEMVDIAVEVDISSCPDLLRERDLRIDELNLCLQDSQVELASSQTKNTELQESLVHIQSEMYDYRVALGCQSRQIDEVTADNRRLVRTIEILKKDSNIQRLVDLEVENSELKQSVLCMEQAIEDCKREQHIPMPDRSLPSNKSDLFSSTHDTISTDDESISTTSSEPDCSLTHWKR